MSSPTSEPTASEPQSSPGISRRKLFGAAGVTAAVVGAASAGALAGRASAASTPHGHLDAPVPFRGDRQAGIITEAQDRMHFCAFDVTTDNRDDVVALLQQWTHMAERMTRGEETEVGGAVDGNPYAPPSDTGEALGLPASQLTLTIGFGPSFFVQDGKDRFGIADQLPAELAPLPKFPNETMDPARCGGDICVQACANAPQVAVHAIRTLARVGFKDGTANLKADETELLDRNVWVADGDGPAWLTGGSYLITRRIRMRIENWDRTTLIEQERVIGRQKGSGAPNGLNDEFEELNFDLTDDNGTPAVDVDAHVRLVSRQNLGGVEILRRGYNFTDGTDGFGHLDAGLFFIAFVRSPEKQFIPMLGEMSRKDAMNEYITHTGTAVFACPPGLREGDTSGYWGSTLFA